MKLKTKGQTLWLSRLNFPLGQPHFISDLLGSSPSFTFLLIQLGGNRGLFKSWSPQCFPPDFDRGQSWLLLAFGEWPISWKFSDFVAASSLTVPLKLKKMHLEEKRSSYHGFNTSFICRFISYYSVFHFCLFLDI